MKISEIVQRLVAGAAEYPLPGTLILLETGKTLHLRLLNDFWFVFTTLEIPQITDVLHSELGFISI